MCIKCYYFGYLACCSDCSSACLLQEKVKEIMKEKQKKARKEEAREEVTQKRKCSKKNVLDRFRKTSKT